MAYSAARLITDSYYLSGVVARNFEVVSAEQMTDGLNLLNFILADKNFDAKAIPFYTKYETVTVISAPFFFVPNLIIDETLTFYIGSTRFPTQRVSRDQFFGTGRANFDSLIFTWHPERCLNGTNIHLFPFPNAAYPVEIWGKFALTQLTNADVDLSLSYELAYINYFKHKLAQRICQFNTKTFPPEVKEELKIIEDDLGAMNPIDFTQKYISTLADNENSPTWALVNLDGYWGTD